MDVDLEIYALYSSVPARYPSNRISDEYEETEKKSEKYKQTKISAINQSHGIYYDKRHFILPSLLRSPKRCIFIFQDKQIFDLSDT